ncbi:MAG: histidinol-phosphatase [Eubacteriales bacterium]|nr:histidinol-phosphatase [Eubacteriales bacterium]
MAVYANYHTHTFRCNHAQGSEREYIETALAAGLTTLGFSDHVPYLFENGYYSGFRMRPELAEDYVKTLLSLREEYRGQITILIGFESEYYPALFQKNLQFLSQYPIDYLIQGQHLTKNEYDGAYMGQPFTDAALLRCYVDQTIEGLATGSFSYLAHPDLPNFTGDADVYRSEMGRLCAYCSEHAVPLEINLLGMVGSRNYPCDRFFQIAAEKGCQGIIGCDAHAPQLLHDAEGIAACEALAQRTGLSLLQQIPLRDPFACL